MQTTHYKKAISRGSATGHNSHWLKHSYFYQLEFESGNIPNEFRPQSMISEFALVIRTKIECVIHVSTLHQTVPGEVISI
jgi:hypothetical protein